MGNLEQNILDAVTKKPGQLYTCTNAETGEQFQAFLSEGEGITEGVTLGWEPEGVLHVVQASER